MFEDKKTLNVIVDISGSMIEGGKRLIARGIVRQIEQYIRLEYGSVNLRLFSANEQVTLINWNVDEEYPEMLFDCCGSLNLDSLAAFVLANSDQCLILTDCSWSSKGVKKFAREMENLPIDTVRIIKIGAEQAFSIKTVKMFEAEDILLTLEKWIGALAI